MHKFNAKFITGVNSSVDGIKTVQSLPFGKSSGGKTLSSFSYIFQYKPVRVSGGSQSYIFVKIHFDD